MRAIPEVIGIVYGVAKVRAVLAAVHGGLVDSLVTPLDPGHGADRGRLMTRWGTRPQAIGRAHSEVELHGGTAKTAAGCTGWATPCGARCGPPRRRRTHLLRYLEEVGFDGVPRVLGIDEAGSRRYSVTSRRGGHRAGAGLGAHGRRAAQLRGPAARFHDAGRRLQHPRIPVAGLGRRLRSTAAG